MPEDSIMDMVNNIESLYNDKNGLYRKWIREDQLWDEKRARKDARALAAHFAEAIEAMRGWPPLRQPHYKPADFDQAADEMIEEFKNEERPKWSIGGASLGAVEGLVVTHDGETIKTGFLDVPEVIRWFHKRHSFSVDHAVQHEGYDIVFIKNGKVAWSYKKTFHGKPK